MKSVFKKSRLFIMLASLLGVVSPMAQAADLVPVQPTVAVVDEQHQAISWANLMLNGFSVSYTHLPLPTTRRV